ncbi:MAG: hypothetical protein HQL21_06085 [Candidatus Omnitrophica bacterium]|nr:hypothetical protein [Candidatus Omnitrophota bacterium]
MVNFPMVFIAFLFASLSFIYELMIAQIMAFFTADLFVWCVLIGGVFLGSMGLGIIWSERSPARSLPIASFVFLNCFQALIGGISVIALYVTFQLTVIFGSQNYFLASGIPLFLVAFWETVLIGFWAGEGLFLLTDMGQRGGISSAWIRIIYYLGIFAAGVSFVLVPYISSLQIALAAGWASALLALYSSWGLRDEKDIRPVILSTVLVIVFGVLLWQASAIEMFFLQKHYSPVKSESSWKDFFVSQGPQASLRRYSASRQQVDFVRFPSGGEEELGQLIRAYHLKEAPNSQQVQNWGLFINGALWLSSAFEDFYFETFAHVPVAALGISPKNVLILGGGDGLLAREILKLSSVKRIDVVDDKAMMEVFGKEPLLRTLNRGSLKDPRVRVVGADTYDFIRRDRKVYDAIYLEFLDPLDYDSSKLFSQEFLSAVKARLAPQGFIVMAAAGFFQENGDSSSDDRVVLSRTFLFGTLEASGFETVVPFFSRLEKDNPAALVVMRKIAGEEKGLAEDMLSTHVGNLRAGFLLVVPRGDIVLKKDFLSPGTLHVLNEDRYRLSLDPAVHLSPSMDGVNTIFSPQLPRPGSWWKIRSPY